MTNQLISFLDKLDNSPNDIGQLIINEKLVLREKGFGRPEVEMKFLHQLFMHIQASHPQFETFSWLQSNAYNDNYFHFQLDEITVNDKLNIDSGIYFYYKYEDNDILNADIRFDAVDYPDPDEIAYAKENMLEFNEGMLGELHWNEYFEYIKKKYQHLEIPCLKFLAVLKIVEINFSMYYFLHAFGNGVEVKFNKEGVIVTKIDENEKEGATNE